LMCPLIYLLNCHPRSLNWLSVFSNIISKVHLCFNQYWNSPHASVYPLT
jgi:hypothetical protein